MPLQDRAENVLPLLLSEKRLTRGSLVFVGHSLGGLLIKQFLRSAADRQANDARSAQFLSQVRRVAFIGTPHLGASLAQLADWFRVLVRPSSSTAALKRNDPHLRNLNVWYRDFVNGRDIEHLVLTETRRKWFGMQVVLPDSADPGLGVTRPIPIDADHNSIVKPRDRNSQVYVLLRDFLSEINTSVGPQAHIPLTLTSKPMSHVVGVDADVMHSDRSGGSAAALTAKAISNLAGGSRIVDEEAEARLERLLKSRFFGGHDVTEIACQLTENVLSGELAIASQPVKMKVFAWCSRILSSKDPGHAEILLKAALNYGHSDLTEIARSFITGMNSDTTGALEILARIGSPMARSAAYMILHNVEGPQSAFDWLNRAGLTPNDLDSDGKLMLIVGRFQMAAWDDAIDLVRTLTSEDYENTPALRLVAGDAYVASTVPPEFRGLIVEHVFLANLRDFPFSIESDALNLRRTARELYEACGEHATKLGLSHVTDLVNDRALWLSLRDPEYSEAAKEKLRANIRDSDKSLRSVPLALAFGLDLDLKETECAIERAVALAGGKSFIAAVARFALAFHQSDPAEAAAYIEKHRDEIEGVVDKRSIKTAETEMLAQAGQVQLAEQALQEAVAEGLEADQERRLRRQIAEAAGNDPLNERLKAYQANHSLADLQALVLLLEERRDWSKLASFGAKLFEQTHSLVDGKRLAQARFEIGQLDELFELFAEYPALVDESDDMRMLSAWAYYERGDLQEAAATLKRLAAYRDSESYRALTLNIAITSGDWDSLQVFCEAEWSARAKRSARELVRAAKIAQHIESPRTKELVIAASEQGRTDPKVLISCYGIATESGWESTPEVASWLHVATSLSDESGPVQTMSMEDLLDRQPRWVEHENETWRHLNSGKMPIFATARALNRSLLSLFLLPSLANLDERDVRKRGVVYAFSGAREKVDLDIASISIDPTALLTMAVCGVAHTVLGWFKETVIPHSTLSWLFEEQRRVLFHQPSRVRNAHEVRRMLSSGSIIEFQPISAPPAIGDDVGVELAQMLADAKVIHQSDARQRIVITNHPINRIGSLMKEEVDVSEYMGVIASCFAIVDKLVEKGELTASRADECRSYIGLSSKGWPDEPSLQDRAVIYLDDASVSYLQHLKLLPALQRAGLTVYISKNEIRECDALIAYDAQSSKAAALINNLRLELRNGILSGSVKVGPMIRTGDDETFGALRSHPSLSVLDAAASVDAIVVDDRYLNQNRGLDAAGASRPILTSLDIFDLLLKEQVIDWTKYAELRLTVRRSGMALVPVESGELERYLAAASVRDGVVVETAELKAIRESIMKLAMTDVLQFPQEAAWLDTLISSCYNTLKYLWASDIEQAEAAARSDWIIDLWDARRWAHRLAMGGQSGHARYRGQLVALMTIAMHMDVARRSKLWKWLDDSVLQPLMNSEYETYAWLVEQAALMVDMGVNGESGAGQ